MKITNAHFPQATKYWYEGKFLDWSALTIHPMAHALHYGTSVFEGIRAYPTAEGPAIFRLPEHLDRFLFSAAFAKMKVPYGRAEIAGIIKATIRKNKMDGCYIRPLLFYSYGNPGLVPKFSPVELVVATWEWGAYLGEKAARGVLVYILPWRRVHHSQIDMRAKLGGFYMQSTICGLEARAHGADEAVFLNLEGRIAEGPGQNIFIVKNGVVKTNDRSESILEGITRTSLLEIARDLGYKTKVGPIAKDEFLAADEAFFTGTAVEVVPIVAAMDGSGRASSRVRKIGGGKAGGIAMRLREAYLRAVRGETRKYRKWLTAVKG